MAGFRIFGFNANGAGPEVEIKVFTLSVENQKHVRYNIVNISNVC